MEHKEGQRPAIGIRFLHNEWPNKDELTKAWTKLRDLRLLSLKLSPEAYASTYEQEAEFIPDVWIGRVKNPAALHIVATIPKTDKTDDMDDEEWVGLIVVIRKRADEDADASKSPWSKSSDPANMNQFTRLPGIDPGSRWFQVNGMFVHPSVRQRGLGKKLIEASLAWIHDRMRVLDQPSSKVVILVDVGNEAAIGLYRSTGFTNVEEYSFMRGDEKHAALKMTQEIWGDRDRYEMDILRARNHVID
ncbi:MAG: hypothetical protein MMC33_005756 [Icmadophila ericetorum]|nr:hypothetical protein [Icmadophila ericetorum]